MTNDKPGDDNLFDLLDGAINFYEENKDMFKSVVPQEDTVKIDGKSPLKQAQVTEDSANITIEVPGGNLPEVGIREMEEGVAVDLEEETIRAEIPGDCDLSKAEANLNNGVLDISIPRTGGDE